MTETKICCKCKKVRELADFNFKNKSLNIFQKACRDCTRMEIKNHYYLNKQYYLDKAKNRNLEYRRTIKNYILDYLSIHPCIDCGEKDPIVLEFDHQRDKSFTISSKGRDKNLIALKEEILKCEVRCANCHRRRTFRQFGWHKQFMPL